MRFEILEDFKVLERIYHLAYGRVPSSKVTYFKKRVYMHFFELVDVAIPEEMALPIQNGRKVPEIAKDSSFEKQIDTLNILYQFWGICFKGVFEEFLNRINFSYDLDELVAKSLIKK